MHKLLLVAAIMMWAFIPALAQTSGEVKPAIGNEAPAMGTEVPATVDSAAAGRKAEAAMSTESRPPQTEVDRKAATAMGPPTSTK
jgi:hypothetical protein